MRVLVAGWFSFEQGHVTAGDLLACDLICDWLAGAGCPYDVAAAPPLQTGVDWRSAEPGDYSHVVFVCGPFSNGPMESELLGRFAGSRLVGVSLSMLVPLDEWDPFDLLLERDSSARVRPDITFLSPPQRVPVVGVCLVEDYEGALVRRADAAVARLLSSKEVAAVSIDTRLDTNSTGLRSAVEIESVLARMDVVVTTRLHGMILALKNGVPAVAIDPEPGGAKIMRQAELIGWPMAFEVTSLTDSSLQSAFDYCLSESGRARVQACTELAVRMAREVRDEFIREVAPPQGAGRPPASARDSAAGKFGAMARGASGPQGRGLAGAALRQGGALLKAAARLTLPARTRFRLRNWLMQRPSLSGRHAGAGGSGKLTPFSRSFGLDRGKPVDRYYIEGFLSRHKSDVRGAVLEIGDNHYTRIFGGGRVSSSDVLHSEEGSTGATIIADLTRAEHVPSGAFDCVIFTQTLQLIYDVPSAIRTLHRILAPGGVLLATFPGITQTGPDGWENSWFWRFTPVSARRLFGEVFGDGNLEVESHGNVLAACAFLQGVVTEELSRRELDYRDPNYDVTVAVRAVKLAERI